MLQEKAKERQLREEMESKLREKERQLMEMQNRHLEVGISWCYKLMNGLQKVSIELMML